MDGLAVDLCGFSRSTEDVDIIVSDDEENIINLLQVLENFGEGAAKELTVDDFQPTEGCIKIAEEFDLDVFTVMRGNFYADLLSFSHDHKVGAETIKYLSAEGLILLKGESVRPKDQIDVIQLKKILKES